MPVVWEPLYPRAVVLTNLFRDQLDRYGEIDLVAGRWRTALNPTRFARILPGEEDKADWTFGNPLTFKDPFAAEYGAGRFGHQEGFHGARHMLDEGLLEIAGTPERALALHITSTLDSGLVQTRAGAIMASSDVLRVTVTGEGGHASAPCNAD